MPLYEYRCKANNHRFEVRHGMNEPSPAACPVCGAEIRRVIHPVGIVFKGSGFYATDSRASAEPAKPAKKDEKPRKPEKTEGPGSESSKSEGKSDGKSEAASGDTAKSA